TGASSGTCGEGTAEETTESTGWPDVASAERKCAESLVAVEVTANVYVPAPVTTELTSNVTVVAAAAGGTDLISAPIAGSFLAFSVFSAHVALVTFDSLTGAGNLWSSRVSVSVADVTEPLVTLNFRYVTSVSPFTLPAYSLSEPPKLYVGRLLELYVSS